VVGCGEFDIYPLLATCRTQEVKTVGVF
jgi:hypothetical protein